MSPHNDTIAAIATPVGEGGISIIRISGSEAIPVAGRCLSAGTPPDKATPRMVLRASLVDESAGSVDDVLYTVFRSPGSYTGEDTVEISCHGGLLVTRRVLEAVLRSGARHAGPGEFTKRAFLNGKIDLAQAEAVAELIKASSDRARKTSLSHLHGELSGHIETIRTGLVDALGLLELELDFAEDGYEFADKSKVERLIRASLKEVGNLVESYTRGKVIRDGVETVLAGAPNAGKSSLMNRLLRESRAIVTEVPGTTRDVISESILIEGVLFRLSDTAGIRDSRDLVEQEGVRRSKEKLMAADVIVLVLDASRDPDGQLDEIGEDALSIIKSRNAVVQVVYNKTDINSTPPAPPKRIDSQGETRVLNVSAKTGDGIRALEETLIAHVPGLLGAGDGEGQTVTTERHHSVLLEVAGAMKKALDSVRDGQTGEFIALDLRAALDRLGEITGVTTSEDVLNSIFERFCIGK